MLLEYICFFQSLNPFEWFARIQNIDKHTVTIFLKAEENDQWAEFWSFSWYIYHINFLGHIFVMKVFADYPPTLTPTFVHIEFRIFEIFQD